MQITQVWLPTLGGSLNLGETSRDAGRAFGAWDGESVVWLLPMIKRPVRWRDQSIGHLALPSESLDLINVVHVTEKRMICAPVRQDLPTDIVGLLDAWLNIQAAGGCDFVVPPDSLTFPIPAFDDGLNCIGTRHPPSRLIRAHICRSPRLTRSPEPSRCSGLRVCHPHPYPRRRER